MRTGMGCIAVLVGTIGIPLDVAAAPENNSSLAPLAPLATIVLAQAAVPSAGVTTDGSMISQPDYLLKACKEFSSGGGGGVDPAYSLKNFLQHRDKQYIELASIKTSMLEGTKHGKIFAEVDNTGLTSYHYAVEPGYLGDDKAVFMVEFEGKHYRVVINFVITEAIDENSPQCPAPQLIKVNGKPVSGSSSYDEYCSRYFCRPPRCQEVKLRGQVLHYDIFKPIYLEVKLRGQVLHYDIFKPIYLAEC